MLKKATINEQDIKSDSPNNTFQAEWKSLMELKIINKSQSLNYMLKQHDQTLYHKTDTAETDRAMVFTEKINMLIGITPNSK